MSDFRGWLQLLALAPVTVAAVPLFLNQCAEIKERDALRARATELAAVARQARESNDIDLAGQAFAEALELDRSRADLRDALMETHVEQVLADGTNINAANALRLHVELAEAVTRPNSAPSVRQILAFGRVLQFRGDLDQARARYEQAAELDSKEPLAHLLLGDALFKVGKYEAAAVSMDRALSLDPELAPARFVLGQIRLQQGKAADALPLLEKAVETMGQNAAVHQALAKAYIETEAPKKALESAGRALVYNQEAHTMHRLIGDANAELGHVEPALRAYKLAFERAGDVEAVRRMARIFVQTKQAAEAIDAFSAVRALLPEDVEANCQIAAALAHVGELETSAQAFQACVKLAEQEQSPSEYIEAARSQLEMVEAKLQEMRAEAERKEAETAKAQRRR